MQRALKVCGGHISVRILLLMKVNWLDWMGLNRKKLCFLTLDSMFEYVEVKVVRYCTWDCLLGGLKREEWSFAVWYCMLEVGWREGDIFFYIALYFGGVWRPVANILRSSWPTPCDPGDVFNTSWIQCPWSQTAIWFVQEGQPRSPHTHAPNICPCSLEHPWIAGYRAQKVDLFALLTSLIQ